MGKGGSFSNWLKEFCTIVLIQSLQAFLFSIIVVLIVTSYNQSKADESSKALGLGVVGVVGLASLSKLEDLVKKMLGVGGSFDPSMKLSNTDIATGLMAGKIAGRVLNNGSNFAKGVSGYRKASKEETKVKQAELRRLNLTHGKPAGESSIGSGSTASGSSGSDSNQSTSIPNPTNNNQNTLNPSKSRASANNYAAIANKARKNAGSSNGSSGSGSGSNGSGSGSIGSNEDFVAALANAVNQSGGANGNARLKEEDLRDAYKDKIKAIKDKKGDAIASVAKSFTGTVGAGALGITGAVMGAATGDVGTTLKGLGTGMGAGDYLGEKSIDLTRGTKRVIKGSADLGKQIIQGNAMINKKLDKEIETRRKEVDDMFDKTNFDFSDSSKKK